MPEPNSLLGHCRHVWLFSSAGHVAHYYPDGSTSACHRWAATTLDKPAAPGARRCPACKEAVKHGLG